VTFGGWLKAELHVRDMSMSELARRIGTNPGTVSRWMSDERKPDYKSCEAIARILQYQPEAVLAEAGYTPFVESRKQALEAEAGRIQLRLVAIRDQFKQLQREEEDLSDRFEEVHRELMDAQEAVMGDVVEQLLNDIDRLPLAEDAKDRLRIHVIDEVEARAIAGEQGAKDGSPGSQRRFDQQA
jgi:transcriptional regulator with XRE-family HTH domain